MVRYKIKMVNVLSVSIWSRFKEENFDGSALSFYRYFFLVDSLIHFLLRRFSKPAHKNGPCAVGTHQKNYYFSVL